MNHSLKSILLTSVFLTSITTATTINVPDDSTTIQAALNAAQQGDIVLVQSGTYHENIFWPDVDGIKLISAGDSSNTVIDGGGIGSVIYMNPLAATIDGTTEIRGFKITNGGNVANGGGMFVSNASPLLTRLWVTGNTAWEGSGGGLYISGGNPTLTYVNVTGNTAWEGSGGGLYISGSSPTLTYVTVTGNTATGAGDGGGLCISGGSPTLTDVTVSGNTATDDGGGLYIQDSSPTLTDVTLTGNTATGAGDGGGLYILRGSPTLTGVTVIDNTASSGGGLYIQDYSPTLMGVTVTGNTAGNGGGLYIRSGSPALVNITVTGNTSGIYVESGTPTIASSNIAYHGAGLYNADYNKIVDADSIWWGDSSGPYHPTENPSGLGDNVNRYVDITPYLTEPDTAAPPIRVQNLTIDSTGYDFVELSWDASPIGDLAGYRIYFDTDSSGFPYSNVIGVGSEASYALEDLSTGLTYYIAATCYDTDGNESWYSQEVSATPKDITAPASPTSLVFEAGDGLVILTWDKNTESDFLRYRIYGGITANPTTAIDSTESALDTTRTISELDNGTTYYFRVTAVNTALKESGFSNEVSATPTALAVEESSGIPASFALHPAYPNPFNPAATIRYDLPEAANITILVYDILGREISRLVDGHVEPGHHQVIWDGKDRSGREVPTGIYIARMFVPPTAGVTPEYTRSIKMLLIK